MSNNEKNNKIRIAHIASHRGNVGDILNHKGFYKYIISELGEVEIEKIELRDFYYSAEKRKEFNKEYAVYLNKFDLVIIGGGGFFDVQWNESATGTTLDFSDEFIDELRVNVVVNGIGYHEYPEVTTDECCYKYKRFIDIVKKKNNWILTYRNDGSLSRMKNRYGEDFLSDIAVVPDSALYLGIENSNTYESKSSEFTIGMCITNELFSSVYNNGVKENEFNNYVSGIINTLCGRGYRVQLIPHTPADIQTISIIMNNIKNEYKRQRITVGVLDCNSSRAIDNLNCNYQLCDCVIGMRFHSCIMGLNCRIPTIGLAGHEQIEGLFKELMIQDYLVKVDNLKFADKLIYLVDKLINERNSIQDCYNEIYKKIYNQKTEYCSNLKNIFIEKEIEE